MTKAQLLTVDAIINLALGIVLAVFPSPVVAALGIPAGPAFYPSILGAVLFGVGLALIFESRGRPGSGLGLNGAVAINLSGGLMLAAWLTFGDLALPTRGFAGLWALVVILLGLSTVELLASRK